MATTSTDLRRHAGDRTPTTSCACAALVDADLRRRQGQGLHRRPGASPRATRRRSSSTSRRFIQYGASPRATHLPDAGRQGARLPRRAAATSRRRTSRRSACDVLRHRVIVTYEAEAEEMTSDDDRAADLRWRAGAVRHGAGRGERLRLTAPRTREPRPWHATMLTREQLKAIRQIQIRTSRLVSDLFAGQYHSVFKGRGMEFDEVRAVPARRRRPHDRLERHRAHGRAVRQALRRGARADGDAAGRRQRLDALRHACSSSSGSWRRSWRRCSPSRPSATTTRSAWSSSPTASSWRCRRARATATCCASSARSSTTFRTGAAPTSRSRSTT